MKVIALLLLVLFGSPGIQLARANSDSYTRTAAKAKLELVQRLGSSPVTLKGTAKIEDITSEKMPLIDAPCVVEFDPATMILNMHIDNPNIDAAAGGGIDMSFLVYYADDYTILKGLNSVSIFSAVSGPSPENYLKELHNHYSIKIEMEHDRVSSISLSENHNMLPLQLSGTTYRCQF